MGEIARVVKNVLNLLVQDKEKSTGLKVKYNKSMMAPINIAI